MSYKYCDVNSIYLSPLFGGPRTVVPVCMTFNVDANGNVANAPATYKTNEVTTNANTLTIGAPADTTPPVITRLGEPTVTIIQGQPYTDAGATAEDNVDGNITNKIVTSNPVNTAIIGNYTVTYNVIDNAGNAADEVTRLVTVEKK